MPIGKNILEMSDKEFTEFVIKRRGMREMKTVAAKKTKKKERSVAKLTRQLGLSNQTQVKKILEEELSE